MGASPLFSFIFVNFRSASRLERVLASLTRLLENIPHEFVIVNNDLGEREAVAVFEQRFGARVIQATANYGFSRANNDGARLAKGEILFFLNPDTRFVSGNFESIRAILATFPTAVVGARLITPQGKMETWSFGRTPTLWRICRGKITGWPEEQLARERRVFSVDWVSGAAFAVRKTVFQSLGGFDERFFLYYEDVDFCGRATQAGSTVFTTPFLVFSHERGRSHPSHAAMKANYFSSQRLYFEKHGNAAENFLLSIFRPLYRLFSS